MAPTYPYLLAGRFEESPARLEVLNPYDHSPVGTAFYAPEEAMEQAIRAAARAFEITRKLPSYERSQILARIAQGIEAGREEITRVLCLEAGKPWRDAALEVERALLTFQTASEEAKRLEGEVLPLDFLPSAQGRIGILRRFPIGPVAAITPFNFPLNLAAHKLAPAIASGNPIVLKPPSKTPLTMLTVARILAGVGLPEGAVSILPLGPELYDRFVSDPRFALLTFTGSPAVGWSLKQKAGKKRVVLELGGNAGVIVDESADLPCAVSRIRTGGFSYAGQSCISVQRVYVHEAVYDRFVPELVEAVRTLKMGDPLDPETEVGPMISASEAARALEWIEEAVSQGAKLLTGGRCEGAMLEPTVLEDVPPESRVCRREVFAPVIGLYRFSHFQEAVSAVNDSDYGLQAGVFTGSLEHAFYAHEELQAGGVMINDVPTWRIDPMPYGGVKDSGTGREGVRFAMEEMTEPKLMVINRSTG